jgi:hypothetical protein
LSNTFNTLGIIQKEISIIIKTLIAKIKGFILIHSLVIGLIDFSNILNIRFKCLWPGCDERFIRKEVLDKHVCDAHTVRQYLIYCLVFNRFDCFFRGKCRIFAIGPDVNTRAGNYWLNWALNLIYLLSYKWQLWPQTKKP